MKNLPAGCSLVSGQIISHVYHRYCTQLGAVEIVY